MEHSVVAFTNHRRGNARTWTPDMGWRAQAAERDAAAVRAALLEERRREYNSVAAQRARNVRARIQSCEWKWIQPADVRFREDDDTEIYRAEMNGAAERRRQQELEEDFPDPVAPSPEYNPVAPSTSPTSPSYSPTAPADGGAALFDSLPPHPDDERARQQALRGFNNNLVAEASLRRLAARARREEARAADAADASEAAADAAQAAQAARAGEFDRFREPVVDESDSEEDDLAPAGEAEEEDLSALGECLICQDAPRTHLCAPCGHLTMCKGCADRVKAAAVPPIDAMKCPYCRDECVFVVQMRLP